MPHVPLAPAPLLPSASLALADNLQPTVYALLLLLLLSVLEVAPLAVALPSALLATIPSTEFPFPTPATSALVLTDITRTPTGSVLRVLTPNTARPANCLLAMSFV